MNAAGAFDLYRKPLIVVDFGTAATFDVVAGDGAHLGGAIAPGLQAAMTPWCDEPVDCAGLSWFSPQGRSGGARKRRCSRDSSTATPG